MELFQAILFGGIGVATGAILYNNYFRKASAKITETLHIENAIPLQIPAIGGAVSAEKTKHEKLDGKKKAPTPLNALCGECKKASPMPFRCKFCTSLFCSEHRLPENHSCESL